MPKTFQVVPQNGNTQSKVIIILLIIITMAGNADVVQGATVSINTTDGRNHLIVDTFEINAVQHSVCAPGRCQFSSPGMSNTHS